MAGLPFGAAQQHGAPAEFQTYEGVSEIEFIDMDPDLPYPRSAAYRKTEQGAQMRFRNRSAEIEDVDLSESEARAFIDGVKDAGLFAWHRVYRPAQGTFVLAAPEWRAEVRFDKIDGKRCKALKVEGEGTYPDNFEAVAAALMAPMPVVDTVEEIQESGE